ncbi:acyltransferase family protein [Rhodococcus sp. 15-649-2-2]|uniref:acyltransferase family protein n=1 Tax=Rhodococcus sp. 15-649-2-2 TaxID=2023140 RepID=UPI00211B705B|nr:acyltransferase family protein [Rhodococcus sp. 15-649-2-2]
MTTMLRNRARAAGKNADSGPRPDIQGLRMVAVMLVVLSHLFDWPRGGFIGVDVFFVISGFLITGSLLHTQERYGRISFANFYRRRIRRIVPAATLVLLATVIASYLILSATRAKSTLLDAGASFLFFANWRFAAEGTDYFTAGNGVSPLQHYWSLSVEEQFYFVWPAVIVLIGLAVGARSRRHRLALSAAVMGAVVVASFAYSVWNTAESPTWAYFSTFARVWELGVGALLAITISYFERLPDVLRPVIAWTGLLAIVIGAFAISETGGGFPAPWAALPVLGAAMVIAAGVSGEHRFLSVLTNRASTYIGDISYSLYLWHWPVIILLGAAMDDGPYLYVAALGLMFSFAVLSYHYFEDPIRKSGWLSTPSESTENSMLRKSRWRLPKPKKMSRENQVVGVNAAMLFTVGFAAIALVPPTVTIVPPVAVNASADAAPALSDPLVAGQLQAELTDEINEATQATAWPDLNPTMEAAIDGPQAPPDTARCGLVDRLPAASCTWGSAAAEKTIMVLGDSVAMTYVRPLQYFAANSGGQWKVQNEAMFGCAFVGMDLRESDDTLGAACPQRKADAIAAVNQVRPDVVIIANLYRPIDSAEWTAGMNALTSQFAGNVGKIVFLAAPPSDIRIGDCYNRLNSPADCISRVTTTWTERASNERELAAQANGLFIDSRPWFCTTSGYCPSFVGSTPVKHDYSHMTPEYAAKIAPVIAEALTGAGL